MSNNTPAPAQRDAVLTDEEITNELRRLAVRPGDHDFNLGQCIARALESALLSKLRAPVAGSVVPPMPPTKDRGPSDFEGYTESDFDWNRSNPGALTWLADNHAAIRAALASPDERDLELIQAHTEGYKLGLSQKTSQQVRDEQAASAPVAGEALNDLQALQWAEKHGLQWAIGSPDTIREVIADAQRLAAPQASEAVRDAIKTFGSKVIKALAAIARANGPDTRKEDDPELIYRDPVMDEVVRIRQAYDELSAALSAQPGAQKEQSDAE